MEDPDGSIFDVTVTPETAKREVMRLVLAGLGGELLPFGSSAEKTQLKAGIVAWMTLRSWQKMKPHDTRPRKAEDKKLESRFCLDMILSNDKDTMPEVTERITDWVIRDWPERVKEIGANVITESQMIVPVLRSKAPAYWNIRVEQDYIVVKEQHDFHGKNQKVEEIKGVDLNNLQTYVEASFSCHWVPTIKRKQRWLRGKFSTTSINTSWETIMAF